MAAKILFLDDSEDLRVLMAQLIKVRLREECIALASLDDLVTNQSEVINCQLAIIDINLGDGQPTGLDAFNWLKKYDFKGRVFFLTGHARSHPLVMQACQLGAEVWGKPVATEQFISSVKVVLEATVESA